MQGTRSQLPECPCEGDRLALSLCCAPHPDGAGSVPFHSPQCAVGHGPCTSQPGAMTRVSPWPGSAPHGIQDLGEGRDRLHRITRHSRGTSACATPRNAIEPFPGLFPSTQLHGEVSGNSSPGTSAGTPMTIPQSQAPQIPAHILFSPQTNASQQLYRPRGTPAAGFGFQALSWLHNLVSINPVQKKRQQRWEVP